MDYYEWAGGVEELNASPTKKFPPIEAHWTAACSQCLHMKSNYKL